MNSKFSPSRAFLTASACNAVLYIPLLLFDFQVCKILTKHVVKTFDQTGSNWIKLDHLTKLDQTWSNLIILIKLDQTWSNLTKLDQTWSQWIKFVLEKHVVEKTCCWKTCRKTCYRKTCCWNLCQNLTKPVDKTCWQNLLTKTVVKTCWQILLKEPVDKTCWQNMLTKHVDK